MRIRAVIAGLALLIFFLCSAGLSQAAKSPLHNIDNNPPVDEHPWQHGGSPDPGDDPDYRLVPKLIILPGTAGARAVLLIRTPLWISPQGENAASQITTRGDEHHFKGTR